MPLLSLLGSATVLYRDLRSMAVFTVTLVAACIGFGRPGWANRWEGGALLAAFIAYSTYIVGTAAL